MRLVKAASAAVITGLLASAAHATLTITNVILQPVAISSQAKAADGSLNGARSYDLIVTQAAGEKFDLAGVQLQLAPAGSISGGITFKGKMYAPTGHNDTYQPGFGSITGGSFSNLAYDTSLTNPQWTVQVAGSSNDLGGGSEGPYTSAPFNTGTIAVMPTVGGANNVMNVQWGDHQGGASAQGNGNYRVARITIVGTSNNTGGFLNGYLEGSANAFTKIPFTNVYLPIAGDVNGDHAVGGGDLNIVKAHAGQAGNLAFGDVDGDGVVGGSDLNIVKANVGLSIGLPPAPPGEAAGPALGSTVPEPSSMLLIAGSLIGLNIRRRRHGASA